MFRYCRGSLYPSQDDVAFARDNDASYGSVGAAYTQPPYGGQLPQMRTADQISRSWDSMDDTGNLPIKAAPVAPKVSDNLMAGYLASNRSALAGLGFDPRHMAIGNAEPHDWAMSGSYYPQSDQILTTGTYPSTTAHESMHRGMAMLRDAGMMPPAANDMSEESIVRGQMLRNFGDTEDGTWFGRRRSDSQAVATTMKTGTSPRRWTPSKPRRRSFTRNSIREGRADAHAWLSSNTSPAAGAARYSWRGECRSDARQLSAQFCALVPE